MRVLLLFAVLVLSSACARADTASAPMRAWDAIVTADLFAEAPVEVEPPSQQGPDRFFTYAALDQDGGPLLSVAVKIGPAGSQIDAARWRAEFDAATDAVRQRDFPDIGARAWRKASFFSPAGALEAIAFTTSDGLFDILVSVFQASTEIERETISPADAARRINAAYQQTFE